MNIQFFLTVIISSMIIISCGSSSTTSSQRPAMTGAYAGADVTAADVLACANYAVDTREPKGTVRLVKVLSAGKQVVAGMNFKMKLSILNNGVPKTVNVVVWSKLDGTMEVTEWE